MNYERVNWQDGIDGNTPINATNLNTMDKGIEEASNCINGNSPMGSIVVDDVSCKNLFNKYTVTKGYYLNTAGNLEANTSYVVSDFIEVEEGETYFLPTRGTTRTKFYDSSKVATTSTWDVADGDVSFTIPSGVKYIRVSIATSISLDTFQFEKGTEKTPCVEHKDFTGRVDIVTGQETPTNEYEDGKRVYVKKISVSALPNASTLRIAHGLSNYTVTELRGIAYNLSASASVATTLPHVDLTDVASNIAILIVGDNLQIRTGNDRSAYSGNIKVYYTKN